MYVKNHMMPAEKLTVVDVNESLGEALQKITKGNFLSLPVFDGDEFKGFILKESIFRHFFDLSYKDKDSYLNEVKVKDIYRRDYESIEANDYIEKASHVLRELGTPFLAVFDKGKFVGILTHSAIFSAFMGLYTGGNGTRLVVSLFNIPGQFSKMSDVIRKAGGNITNMIGTNTGVMDIIRIVLRVEIADVGGLVKKLEEAGFKVDM